MVEQRRRPSHDLWRALRLGLVMGLLMLALSPVGVGRASGHIIINAGDVPALIAAINTANGAPGTMHEIVLTAGDDYVLTVVNNPSDGGTGLPIVSGNVSINGNGATIRRSDASDTPAFRILRVAPGGQLHLQNLTVSNGFATGLGPNSGGGGIQNFGTLTLVNSTVRVNRTHTFGGGIKSNGTLGLINSFVSENVAEWGGGLYNQTSGILTVTGSTVNGNTASADGGTTLNRDGGGIYNQGTLTLTESTVSGNRGRHGAGINSYGTLIGTASVFSDNIAAQDGGGIRASGDGMLSLTGSLVSENRASWGGGIYTSSTAMLNLTNTTMSGNRVPQGGGGIVITSIGKLSVANSTVTDNTALNGGGIYNDGTLHLSSSLVASNAATQTGPDVRGAVVSGSSYNLIGNDANMTGLTDDDNGNLIGTASSPIDPLLGPLADNGGPTNTIALLDGSSAIDKIPTGVNGCGDEEAALPILTDQRGVERPQGEGCDIGAFEAATVTGWQLVGFHQPVGKSNSIVTNGPLPTANESTVWNTIKGGSTVPLKFNLYADAGEVTSTSAITGFSAVKLDSCASSGDDDPVDFVTTGSTSLRYDATEGQFIQSWKSPKVSGDTCYRASVSFQDGSAISAFFKLRK